MIVHLGNMILQGMDQGSANFAQQVLNSIQGILPGLIGQVLNAYLDEEVNQLLGRLPYQRRRHTRSQESLGECSKCHSRERQKFRRDGHYHRNLATNYGGVRIAVPQMECECGGKVHYEFKTVSKHQRFWVDAQMFIQQEYADGQSYRQIKSKLDRRLGSSVGLRTLNRQILPLGREASFNQTWEEGVAPPVVRVDGIWLTVMFETQEVRPDQRGRLRPVKKAKRIPILAAQGVWPTSGKTEIIAWMRADGEDEASWKKFLEMLYNSGLTPENGLKMLVSDGGLGFKAAYQQVYWMVLHQRCVFHKLKNLARDLKFDSDMTREARKDFSGEFLRSASQIWQAKDKTEAFCRYQDFCSQWQETQPKAVQTLQRDFDAALTFYDAMEQAKQENQVWPPHLLRTTSPLERTFREFRRRFRQAGLFYSPAGAQAATAQLASRFS